jgi:hypothetical protein
MKQFYTVNFQPYPAEHPLWYYQVEIEPNKVINIAGRDTTCLELIRTIVEYWPGYQERLREEAGDYTACYLKQMAKELFSLTGMAHGSINLADAIGWFRKMRGYVPVDGSHGIQLVAVSEIDLSGQQFVIQKSV